MSRTAASQPVQRRRSVQSRKHWERCATKAVGTEAAAAGRPSSITTREYDEVDEGTWGQRSLLEKKRRGSSKTAETYNHQNAQHYGLLTVGALVEDIRVLCNTGSSECPTTVVWEWFGTILLRAY